MAQDFYSILGVSKSASQDEIKKAYRKLAHQHHPDKQGGDEKKFKEVNEAYQTLGNAEKRSQYDRFGQTFGGSSRAGGSGPFSGGQGNPFEGFDFSGFSSGRGFEFGGGMEDMFSDFFGGGSRQKSQRGHDIGVDVEISFEEMANGATREMRLRRRMQCSHCHGKGGETEAGSHVCSECRGSGKVRKTVQTIFGAMAQVAECSVCRGKGNVFEKTCRECRGAGSVNGEETIRIEIPAGIDDGQTISLSGKGEAGEYGSVSGDLYVTVHVKPHAVFTRSGNDLHSKVSISISQAVLGGRVEVKTLEGETVMKIPAGTQSGELFRIRGGGFHSVHGRSRGDHIVTVIISIPKKLSRDQRKIMETLEKEGL